MSTMEPMRKRRKTCGVLGIDIDGSIFAAGTMEHDSISIRRIDQVVVLEEKGSGHPRTSAQHRRRNE